MDDTPRPLTEDMRREILDANDAMTKEALRVLGFAYRLERDVPDDIEQVSTHHLESDLVFVGLVGMIDPPREEVKPALAKAQQAGIRTIMITGDYANTARAIAESIGLLRPGHKVATGTDLDAMSDEELKREIEQTDVFARVSPEHKMRIVDALQANQEVVAMTGDGVNDAPAIKRADIGIAMGITGTDVAKGTADMVLTDDNYASIVAAVEQGRIIYSNIRKFVFFLLSANVAEIMIIFLATLAGLPPPLTAIQLLWLNLITDGAPALALAMEKGDPDIMSRKPRARNEPIVNSTMRTGIIVQMFAQAGVVLTAFALGLLWHLRAGDALPAGHEPAGLSCCNTTGAAWTCRRPRPWPSSRSRCASSSGPTPCARSSPRSSGSACSRTARCSGRCWSPSSCCCWCARCPSCSRSSTRTSWRHGSGAWCSAWRSCRRSPRRSPSSSCAGA